MSFHADAAKLSAGSIVRIEKPINSRGEVAGPHYFIVMGIPPFLKPGDIIRLIGISSSVTSTNPSLHVTMKWLNRKGGDPETGLTRVCHACVDFTQTLIVTRGPHFNLEISAEHRDKFIRAEKLQTVWALITALTTSPPPKA